MVGIVQGGGGVQGQSRDGGRGCLRSAVGGLCGRQKEREKHQKTTLAFAPKFKLEVTYCHGHGRVYTSTGPFRRFSMGQYKGSHLSYISDMYLDLHLISYSYLNLA